MNKMIDLVISQLGQGKPVNILRGHNDCFKITSIPENYKLYKKSSIIANPKIENILRELLFI